MSVYRSRQITALIICLVAIGSTYMIHQHDETQSQAHLDAHLNGTLNRANEWIHITWRLHSQLEADQTRYYIEISTSAGTFTHKLPVGFGPESLKFSIASNGGNLSWRKEYVQYTREQLIDKVVLSLFHQPLSNPLFSAPKQPKIRDKKAGKIPQFFVHPLGTKPPKQAIIL